MRIESVHTVMTSKQPLCSYMEASPSDEKSCFDRLKLTGFLYDINNLRPAIHDIITSRVRYKEAYKIKDTLFNQEHFFVSGLATFIVEFNVNRRPGPGIGGPKNPKSQSCCLFCYFSFGIIFLEHQHEWLSLIHI